MSLLGLPGPESIVSTRVISAKDALPIPDARCVDQAERARELLSAAAPGAFLTGALVGLGCASMNDQIVQGLSIAERAA